jgi:hypothetical protein
VNCWESATQRTCRANHLLEARGGPNEMSLRCLLSSQRHEQLFDDDRIAGRVPENKAEGRLQDSSKVKRPGAVNGEEMGPSAGNNWANLGPFD